MHGYEEGAGRREYDAFQLLRPFGVYFGRLFYLLLNNVFSAFFDFFEKRHGKTKRDYLQVCAGCSEQGWGGWPHFLPLSIV